MSRPHLAAGLAFLSLAALLGWEASRLNYYSPLGPGAGFFLVWLCAILALLALGVVVGALRGRLVLAESRFWPQREAMLRIAATVAGLVFVVATLNLLGFRIAMAAFCVWSMLVLGSRNLVHVAVVALLGSVGCHVLFVDLLGVALPGGRLGW